MKAPQTLNLAAAALIGIFCLQAVLAVPRLSATTDEPTHLAAGYSYWKTRDFRMNPEHPPLAKLLAAMPLLAKPLPLDTTTATWKTADEGTFGFRFLYSNDADRLLFWSRIPMILLGALGAAVTYLWARDLFGGPAGLGALMLYAFCPNLLAHGMLVTTDVPLAAFTVLTLYLFWKRGQNPAWMSDAVTGLALGGAMATKFSGAVLPIILIGFCLARKQIKSLFIMAAAALLVIETAYLFSSSPLLYFQNIFLVNANHSKTYPYYLLGRMTPDGWWYYFLVAFAVKATLPVLVLVLFALIRATRGWIDRWGEMILIVTIVVYFVVTTIGAAPVGIRYILPIFPLLYIWISRVVPYLMSAPWGVVVLGIILGWHAWSSISIFPNYIPYFNELAGGPVRGPDILDDSNVDWGQGLKQAAEYVRKQHLSDVNTVFYDSFSGPGPEYYGLPRQLSSDEAMDRLVVHVPAPGTYILSAHLVARMTHTWLQWQAYKPIDRIGESLWVFRF